MNINNEEDPMVKTLSCGINLISGKQKLFKLPMLHEDNYFIQDGTVVELVLIDPFQISIESWNSPIKFGNYYGNRLFFNTMIDKFNINPKFIYDELGKRWILVNAGYVCFAEIEIEYKNNHYSQGKENA
jgi:hypothetical protein